MKLAQTEIDDYLQKHLPYRLNGLRAYDLYISRRTTNNYRDEEQRRKCYWESEFLEPALEISVVFGRSLLDFLGIKKEDKLYTRLRNVLPTEVRSTDICIWDINNGK